MPQDDWDALFPAVGATPAAMPAPVAFPGVIPGRPKAPPVRDPLAVRKDELDILKAEKDLARGGDDAPSGYRWGPDGTTLVPIPGGPADKKASATDPATAVTKLRNVISKIDDVAIDSADNGGWFETGFTGSMMRGVPGTAAKDLASNVATIDANSAFEALAEMRRNSPTGGALGSITEKELDLLRSTVANLDTAQSQGQFFNNLGETKRVYLDMLRRLDPNAADEFTKKRGIRFTEDGRPVLYFVDGDDPRDKVDFSGNPVPGTGDSPGGSGGGDSGPPSPVDSGGPSLDSLALGLKQGAGSVVQGFGDLIGIALNPIGQTLYSATGYGDQRYDTGTILRNAVGLPENTNRTSDAIIRGGTAALTGAGAARGAATLATGAVKGALSRVGSAPAIDTVAGAGAGLGGDLARRNGAGTAGQIGGAVIGGLSAGGGAGVLSRLASPRAPSALAAASERQGVNLLPADAGGPVPKIVTSAARASPISATPVARAAETAQGQMRDASRRVAADAGEILPTDAAGEAVTAAGKRYSYKTSQIGSALYERAHKEAAGLDIRPKQAVAVIDDHLKRLAELPETNSGLMRDLTKLKSDIANGVSVQGLRDARTSLSQATFDGKLRSGQERTIYKQILGALSEDIDGTLRSYGLTGAANRFKRADAYWKDRVEHIDEVLEPIIGKGKGGEQVVQAIEGMARGSNGGNKRLSRLLREMTPQEAGGVRATLIDRIGKATPGQQSAEGTAFSASTFLTNWNRMTPQAKATLFSDPNMRRNLSDIALLAEKMKASQQMANHSNTSAGMQGSAALQGGWAVAHFPSYVLGAGAQFVTGKLMASPKFARWLANSPKNASAPAARRQIEQLGVLATREPLIRADARALQQHLMDSLGQSPIRAAANEKEQD